MVSGLVKDCYPLDWRQESEEFPDKATWKGDVCFAEKTFALGVAVPV